MHKVALLIGGNQGDRQELINQATVLIQERIGTVALASRLYETEPWGEFDVDGEEAVNNFLNRALLVETTLSAHEVLHEALSIEAELGRRRKPDSTPSRKYYSRPMDIDLIFFDDEVIDTPELTIPHPRMHLRRFVLEPLSEIMPDYRHPVSSITVAELLRSL